jgi:hypothetical protein
MRRSTVLLRPQDLALFARRMSSCGRASAYTRKIFMCDNTSALSACVHGYDRSPDMAEMSNLLHMALADSDNTVVRMGAEEPRRSAVSTSRPGGDRFLLRDECSAVAAASPASDLARAGDPHDRCRRDCSISNLDSRHAHWRNKGGVGVCQGVSRHGFDTFCHLVAPSRRSLLTTSRLAGPDSCRRPGSLGHWVEVSRIEDLAVSELRHPFPLNSKVALQHFPRSFAHRSNDTC